MFTAKDPSSTGGIAIIFVWIWLAARIGVALSALFTISVLGGFGGGIAAISRLQLADTFDTWTAIASLLIAAATAIAVLRWIALTNRNAQTWSKQVAITPGWAMGWFFVPVANLFKPFEGVSATWRATVAPADIDTVDVPVILRWWWGLWLAASIWGNATFRLSLDAKTADQLITAHWTSVIRLILDVPLGIVLSHIIRCLSAMQSQLLASHDALKVAHDDPI